MNLFEVPATNLNVVFGISQEVLRIADHLSFQLTNSSFGGPLTAHCGRDLHQSDLAVFSCFPRTKISLFIYDTPNQVRLDAIDRCLAGNQCLISMDPVLVHKVCTVD